MDINQIAKLAGVSRTTVSRYLNDGYVSKEKRERIAQVIKETGYVPSQSAQQLRTGVTNQVGVIIPKINSHSVGRMVAGITQKLAEDNYQVLLANTDNDEKAELAYLRLFVEYSRVDGIILIGTIITDEHREAIAAAGVPVVVLGQHVDDISCVYHDDRRAMHDVARLVFPAAEHPAYLGVTVRDEAAGESREQGFHDACAEAGITPDESAILRGGFSIDSGEKLCEKLVGEHPEVDAIVCATDDIALGAMASLRERGLRVPEDVQVTGLGDNDVSRVVSPALSTVHLGYRTSGVSAARMLVDAMARGEHLNRVMCMGYEVLPRESTLRR